MKQANIGLEIKHPSTIMALFPSKEASPKQVEDFAEVIKPSLIGEAGILVRIHKGDTHEEFLLDCCMRWGAPREIVDRNKILDGATHAVFFARTDSLEFAALRGKCRKLRISTNDLTFDVRET